jgi:predicted metal-binding membrane protein
MAMSEIADRSLNHLSPAAARLGFVAARPRAVAVTCVVTLTTLGWLYIGIAQGTRGDFVATLCRPFAGAGIFELGGEVLVLAMWGAMVLAMMLPSAAPMILTYAEIADTAARKHAPVISPFVLTAGYAIVWLGFATVVAAVQIVLARAAPLDAAAPPGALLSGGIFVGAGLYQFSSLKQACLRQCRSPFPFLFTNWATTTRGVFRLGVKQGLFCLGCCWAAMLLMFALGVMNALWMAVLAVVMTLEKLASGTRLSYAIGAVFIVTGLLFVLSAIAPIWLGRPI